MGVSPSLPFDRSSNHDPPATLIGNESVGCAGMVDQAVHTPPVGIVRDDRLALVPLTATDAVT